VKIADYVASFHARFPFLDRTVLPWEVTGELPAIILRLAAMADASDLEHIDGVLIHRGATVETGAIIKSPALVSNRCFVAAGAYLRGGVFLDIGVTVGPGCEVKTSMVMSGSALAHFNFVGDSIVGADVNMEAGAVVANHHNDRADTEIRLEVEGRSIASGVHKFGAVLGDHCRVGANAVLAPGTVLAPRTIVGRLALVDQGRPVG
jgi:UDP-N-acetylglucosamine diphosphorylase / glucose-1-phosphate thymidylyltransferase / UDP-N-acetylgalactosamine diphosphorylase / glucosamine-1-phosphate N-acetyltransferase / galactosamine-1-phosphate N-acetyltransferase